MGVPDADDTSVAPVYARPLGPEEADPANMAHDLTEARPARIAAAAAAVVGGQGGVEVPGSAQLATWSPLVAAWMGPHVDGIFQAWWAKHKHLSGDGDPECYGLRAIAARPAGAGTANTERRTAVSVPLRS